MDKININTEFSCENIVDYRADRSFFENEVSFHWWSSESTTMHSHNFYEFFIVTEGKTSHEINGTRSYVSAGTLCMICPADCHRLKKADNNPSIHMNLCVTPDKLEKICSSLSISLNEIIENGIFSVSLSREELNFFVSKARHINLLTRTKPGEAACLICALIAQAVTQINSARLLTELNFPEWFSELLERIHSPENRACSAKDIYIMGGFSPPVMIDYFKKFTGRTVCEYLCDVKCEDACILLSHTGLTTLEISNSLGYYSLSHFNRIFKARLGVSPAVYRHLNKNTFDAENKLTKQGRSDIINHS